MGDTSVYCRVFGIPEPVPEFRFHPERKWRIDLAWPEKKLAVEVDGGVWVSGRHNRGVGWLKDMEKHNALTMLGWHLLRFTPEEMKNGHGWRVIKQWMEARNA